MLRIVSPEHVVAGTLSCLTLEVRGGRGGGVGFPPRAWPLPWICGCSSTNVTCRTLAEVFLPIRAEDAAFRDVDLEDAKRGEEEDGSGRGGGGGGGGGGTMETILSLIPPYNYGRMSKSNKITPNRLQQKR